MSNPIYPNKLAALKQIRDQYSGNEREAQRHRLRTAFELFPMISTVEARDGLDILHPAGRVQELREEGCGILTMWATVVSDNGTRHRVANYLWVREVQHAE